MDIKSLLKPRYIIIATVVAFILLGVLYFVIPYPTHFLDLSDNSLKIYDRKENLLMELTPENGGFSESITLKEVPKGFIELLLFSEDRNFFRHSGISLQSMLRALYQNLFESDNKSGGSTITQQFIKMKYRIVQNNLLTKALEIVRALKLEFHYSKDDILRAYLNHLFLGNHIYGLKKACRVYFQKEVVSLSLLEMASVIIAIKAPSFYDLYRHTSRVEEEAKRFLFSAYSNGVISEEAYQIADMDRLSIRLPETEFYAPHFCFWVLEEAKKLVPDDKTIAEIHTTLDIELYRDILGLCQNRAQAFLKHQARHAGVLMVDNRTMEIRVMIGSLGFFGRDEQNNATIIKRQPGSTIKPFTYALALENSQYTPATVIPDIYSEFPAQVGKYIPLNYDMTYHGPVRLALALGSSYNVPAVRLLHDLGFYNLYHFLKRIGVSSIKESPNFYGLGLTLGNADMTLLELVNAYTIFPNLGVFRELRSILRVKTTDGSVFTEKPMADSGKSEIRVLSVETAFLINHILSEYKYKLPAFGANSPLHFPFPVASKTGTSQDFRDNFIVGYNPNWTIGVWMGNFGGESMKKLPSAMGGGVLLRDIVAYLYNQNYDFPAFCRDNLDIIRAKVCKLSGMLAHQGCESDWEYFRIGTEPQKACDWHQDGGIILPEIYEMWARESHLADKFSFKTETALKIVHPAQNNIFKIDRSISLTHQQIPLKAISQSDEVRWLVNGVEVGRGKKVLWQLEKGDYRIEAVAVNPQSGAEERRSVNIIVVD